MSDPAIHLERLALSINGTSILKDITLTVNSGEVVSVIGPSGCGKTTLLNVVAGLAPAWTGTALTYNTPIPGPGPDRSVVFQEDAVFPWMTVEKNVAYPLRMRDASNAEIREATKRLIALVGLTGKESAFPRQLSGGQRKRIDLARALAANPQVLLMDEPYAALDQMTKQRLQQEFLDIVNREHMTSVFVTHDLEEAIYVANRIVVMHSNPGRIAEIVPVPFEGPRDSDLRMSEQFQTIRRHLSQMIYAQEAQAS